MTNEEKTLDQLSLEELQDYYLKLYPDKKRIAPNVQSNKQWLIDKVGEALELAAETNEPDKEVDEKNKAAEKKATKKPERDFGKYEKEAIEELCKFLEVDEDAIEIGKDGIFIKINPDNPSEYEKYDILTKPNKNFAPAFVQNEAREKSWVIRKNIEKDGKIVNVKKFYIYKLS